MIENVIQILLVEDDDLKARKLAEYLTTVWPTANVEVSRSVNAGMRAIRSGRYEVVLLDMSLPTYTITAEESGGRPQPFGGKEILKYMDRAGVYSPVLVITQLESFGDGEDQIDTATLDLRLTAEHPDIYNGLVRFDASSDAWQSDLRKSLARMCPSIPMDEVN